MSNKNRALLAVFTLVIASLLISACKQTISEAPAATPTSLPDSFFVSPMPSAQNPMDTIQQFAKQTAAAQTAIAGGGTPGPAGTPTTPQAVTTAGTMITPQTPVANTTALTPVNTTPSTPTNAIGLTPATGLTPAPALNGPTATSVPVGSRPSTYVLKAGEFPYCIARRFDVDPDQLLSMSGLTSPDVYYEGLQLTIPQSGSFPGPRALAAHPTTYAVQSGDETIYSIACKFGDVRPEDIAAKNGLSAGAKLNAGQSLTIP